jgi:hypothetical protein
MPVTTAPQKDITVGTLVMKVSTNIPHIPKRLLDETGMIWKK